MGFLLAGWSLLFRVLAQSAQALLPLGRKGDTNNRLTKYCVMNVLWYVSPFNIK